MKISIAGKNNIAIEIVEYLIDNLKFDKNNLYIIVNQTDTGEDDWQRSLLKYAKNNNLNIKKLSEVYEFEEMIFLSLEFDKIIKPTKFRTNKLYNIHFSLLPKYKGMFTSIFPLLNNEKYSGATLHKIDYGIDTGNIIDQIKFDIEDNDNARNLYIKYIDTGIKLIKRNLTKIINGGIPESLPQKESDSSYYSNKSIDFNNIQIDLNQTARNIHNQIRAFNFREYQQPIVFKAKIISSKILSTCSEKRPGSIIFEDEISYLLSTVDYNIVLYKDKSEELFNACEIGNIAIVESLILIPNIVNIQNKKGWTPLMVAIYNNHINIVKKLLVNGASTEIVSFNGTTCLMYAKSSFVKHNNPELLHLILDLFPDIYKKDFRNKNVLEYCMENNEQEVLKIIKG